MHEYGHTLQSQQWGPLYMNKIGFPSLYAGGDQEEHNKARVEQDANIRALKHWEENYPNYYNNINAMSAYPSNPWENPNLYKIYNSNVSLKFYLYDIFDCFGLINSKYNP